MLNRGAGRRVASVRSSPAGAQGLGGDEGPGCRHGESWRLSPGTERDERPLMALLRPVRRDVLWAGAGV